MALVIFWTKRADKKFDKIIAYLEEVWGEAVAKQFVLRVYELLDLLIKYPELGSLQHKQKKIRGFVITKQVSLFYKYDSDRIVILNLFDTRQSIKKKGH